MKTNYWLSYPTEYQKQLKPLLHQQMWLFGRDILYPEGNLLYQYKFTHERAGGKASSMYTYSHCTQQIVLWAWGIWFGQADAGAIYVNRYKAMPRFTTVPALKQSIHHPEDLPSLVERVDLEVEVQTMRQLWSDLLLWLAGYEAWILETVGNTWRQTALKPFADAITEATAVEQLPTQWQALAEQSRVLPIKSCIKKEGRR